jgi:hypothetical protein
MSRPAVVIAVGGLDLFLMKLDSISQFNHELIMRFVSQG